MLSYSQNLKIPKKKLKRWTKIGKHTLNKFTLTLKTISQLSKRKKRAIMLLPILLSLLKPIGKCIIQKNKIICPYGIDSCKKHHLSLIRCWLRIIRKMKGRELVLLNLDSKNQDSLASEVIVCRFICSLRSIQRGISNHPNQYKEWKILLNITKETIALNFKTYSTVVWDLNHIKSMKQEPKFQN